MEEVKTKNKKAELLINTIIIFLGKLSSRFVIFLLLPLYTSILDPAEYGLADLISSYITLLIPVLSLELDMGVFRFLVDVREDRKQQENVLHNTLYLFNGAAALFALLYWIINFFVKIPYSLPIFLSIFSGFYWGLLLQVARGYGDTKSYAIGSFITGIVTAISNVILIKHFHWGAGGLILSIGIGYLACIIYFLLRLDLKNRNPVSLDKPLQKRILKYSLPLIPNTVCWWIINAADRTIVSMFLGVAANGIYAISTKFPSAVASVFYTFQVSWSETTAVHINDPDKEAFFSEVFDTVLRFFFSLAIGVVAVMPFIFSFFVKEAYAEAYRYIPIAMIGSLLNCIANIHNGIYTALKRTDIVAKTATVAGIINIVVDFALMKFAGIYAAFISTIAAYLWMLLFKNHNLKQYMNVHYDARVVGLCSVVFGVVIILYYGNVYWNVAGAVMAVVFVIWLNRKVLKGVWRKVKGRVS